ncbi:TRAP transporter substrate-binding protein [Rhodoferax saidenbachensis]|uniref:Tripartite ATP-independent transporter DctP family solute receptor n=1 Tax=Rhodoferax saidenbachensis TaxID=1484693 RepID=A0ABU1ZRU8_9BURK|nr:TRAP transporter substrate-binding protein [Rhodoferax saidenbachensis]MDR7308257.1 tripartite ATP-independent transporter DctP family solute receptor [Rhodoferax saidenbachensis]
MWPNAPRAWALAGLLALACANVGAQTKLRAWNIHPDGYPVTQALQSFTDEVGKATKGRYQIEVFSNATLGDQPKAVQMLKSGEVDVAEFSSGPLSDAVPGLKALNLPFLFTDSAHMFKHLDGKLGERFAAKLQTAGFVVLGWYDGGGRSFYCANRSVGSFKDLAGARIRVQQSEVYIEMVKLLDATPVALPFKEVLGALQQGSVDCAENNMPSFESTGHYKVARSVYVTNHVVSPEALVVSSKLWASLSAEDKEAFRAAGAQSATYMRELWNKRVASAIDIATKQGVQFVRVKDVAPMVRRMAPLYRKYMDDPSTREELLAIIGN